MDKDLKLIKKKYLSLIQELKKNNKFYYEKSDPKISDIEYDKLKIKIFDLEKKFKFLKSKDSPSTSIGFKPSKNFLKHKHRKKMLSLSNAFDQKD